MRLVAIVQPCDSLSSDHHQPASFTAKGAKTTGLGWNKRNPPASTKDVDGHIPKEYNGRKMKVAICMRASAKAY